MAFELLVYLASILFFLLALTRPNYALTLLAGLLPTYLLRFTIFGLPTNFFEVSVWLALCAYLTKPHYIKRIVYSLKSTQWLLIILFVLAATFSALLTPTPHSFGILKSWMITPIMFGLLISTLSSSEERDGLPAGQVGARWMNPLIVSGVIVSLLGLFQLGSLDRITSIYDVPNSLALFLAPLIILTSSRRGFLNYLAALVMFAALLATQSLSGLAAVVLTLLLGLFLNENTPALRRKLITYSLLLIAFASITFTGRLSYFLQPLYNPALHTSLSVRRQLWSISWELIKEHPLRGLGLGQFEPVYQQKLHEKFFAIEKARQVGGRSVALPLREFVFRDPHNWILSFWLNTGLLGLLSFTALNFLALRFFFKKRSLLQPAHYALLTILLFGLLDTIYWKNDLAALQWLILATSLQRNFVQPPSPPDGKPLSQSPPEPV